MLLINYLFLGYNKGVFCEEEDQNHYDDHGDKLMSNNNNNNNNPDIFESVYVVPDEDAERPGVQSTLYHAPGNEDMSQCYDDTECDKGYICSKETHTCQYIQVCDAISGRMHGLRHGECIPCTTDNECGWQPDNTAMKKRTGQQQEQQQRKEEEPMSLIPGRKDHCWPDGGCRHTEPFKLITFKVTKNGNEHTSSVAGNNNEGTSSYGAYHTDASFFLQHYSVAPSKRFSKGDRMCITVAPNIEQEKTAWLSIDIMKLEMCASKTYFEGSISSSPYHRERLEQEIQHQQSQIHPYQRKPDIFYPGIIHYDPKKPSTTGCRTNNNQIRKYTVFTKSEKNPNDMKDHTKHKKNELFAILAMGNGHDNDDNKKHHFHPSTEISTITSGGDTVCFDAVPVTAKDVPIYVEATIRVSSPAGSRVGVGHAGSSNVSIEDQKMMLEMLYGIHNDDDNDINNNHYWRGIVASEKFKSTTQYHNYQYYDFNNGDDDGSNDYHSYTNDDGIFVNCDSGTKFNGVAGLCEAPTIANQVFFWVLIANTLVIIGGSILFVFALKKHKDDMLYLVRNGFIDTD